MENKKERSATEMFLNRDSYGRARQENHRSGKFLKRAIAVCDAKTGDVIDRLILELTASAAIKDPIAKGNIFRPIERFEDAIQEVYGESCA